jgi:hypothetical protein
MGPTDANIPCHKGCPLHESANRGGARPVGMSAPVTPSASQRERSRQSPGLPFPRGATWDGKGVNFSLFSEGAESVELCLFDPSGGNETRIRIR